MPLLNTTPYLQLFISFHDLGQRDFKIAVAAAQLINKGLGLCGILHLHPVEQFVQAAHVGGLGTHEAV